MKKRVYPRMPSSLIRDVISTAGVFVIAEIGKNFIQTEEPQSRDVYLKNAKELIDAAVDAGAHAVKFQTHEVEDEQANIPIISPHFKGSERYAWVKRNTEEAPIDFFRELSAHAKKRGAIFFSTPMSRKAAQKLNVLDLPLWKIGSGDVQDYVLLNYVGSTGKPVIISTGMVSLSELDEVVGHISRIGNPLTILYCVSEYPCPKEYFNLSTIEYLKEKYPHAIIGFSDHSVGENIIPLAAIKAGAQVIEKHFSFSRNLWGSDHKASITPVELKDLMSAIRNRVYDNIDLSPFYGDKIRELQGAQNKFRPYFNKTLVAGCDIPTGTIITEDMLYAMRPRMHLKGFASNLIHLVVGKKTKKTIKKFDPISEEHI